MTNQTIYIHSRTQTLTKVGGGQATLTIPGTNIQIPLGPTQPAQQQTQQQGTQNQSSNQTQQNLNQNQVTTSQQNQQSSQQNVQQTQANAGSQQQQQQQQQQNTVITIPGTNNTIQIPSNFAGKLTASSSYNILSFSLCGAWLLLVFSLMTSFRGLRATKCSRAQRS